MTDHTNTPDTPDTPDPTDRDADARIDALARTAGADLRRPAPADGLARVAKAKQRHQAVRAGAAGTAVIALVAIGTMALRGGDESTVVPATVSTVESPETTVVASTVPSTTDEPVSSSTEPPPDSSSPTTSVEVPPNAAGQPSAVYTAATPVAFADGDQTLVDPVTGKVLGAEPMDADASRAAQDALLGRSLLQGTRRDDGAEWFTTDWQVGDVTYTVESLPSEVTDLDLFAPTTLQRFDRCGQSTLVVTGAPGATGVLPQRVSSIAISPDGRWLVTTSTGCEDGTLADGSSPQRGAFSVAVFDAARPNDASRERKELFISGVEITDLTFSADGRFLAVGTTDDPGFRFFDVESGDELDVFADDCVARGTKWSRFIGPWIGDSSVALQLTCGDGQRLLVRDLASDEELTVRVPENGTSAPIVDVDFGHFDRPASTWFTICTASVNGCWIGQGSGDLVQVAGTQEASFLPLGFTYGG